MMIFYKIISVQWWCIFILYSQRAECASFFSTADSSSGSTSTAVPSLCGENGESSEQYVSDKGPSSSVLLALRSENGKPSASVAASCKRQFRAPDAYNFFVRLQRAPTAPGPRSSAGKKYASSKTSNSTHSCPLTISQSANGELLPAWRLDPCLLETSGLPDEPMRLLQGKLNIVWNHDGNAPNYRLHLTVVGQGTVCVEREKHSCLDYAGTPLLCIARELICDGQPNCPPVGNDVLDENEVMCAKHLREEYSENPVQSVFRKYIQSTIKSFFVNSPTGLPTPAPPAVPATEPSVPAKKQRSSLTGLSKYGPWGYLFLGMLICGSALLICGLWECCCRSHKPEQSPDDSLPDPVPSFLQTSPGGGDGGRLGAGPSPGLTAPPYGELDPPPAYSVLFPNQKPSDVNPDDASPDTVDSQESTSRLADSPPPDGSGVIMDAETGSQSQEGDEVADQSVSSTASLSVSL
ncbi:uncharacterized protein LOC131294312 [Anopheles ziemanni]|uniref:uncharacterized protein LOC131294312 n=1 Tax=Anopheles ziemanni TaxID=345580 RepID=UPI00265D6797|nr:uncharacterized protein LOC131294312 [Anopheles ziemanni]